MKESSPPRADLVEELRTVRDSVEQLYLLLDHIWRNRDELREIIEGLVENMKIKGPGEFPLEEALEMGLGLKEIRQAIAEGVTTAVGLRRIEKNTRAEEVPESIACAYCDADSPESLAEALQEGWTRLQRDDGPGWNYLGVCPACQALEDEPPQSDAREPEDRKEQKQFFA
jgi:hypothetical protein